MTGLRHGKFLVHIALVSLLLCAIPLVSADELYPTITHVFFEKDGVPFNESVHYTVNCTGHTIRNWYIRDADRLAVSGLPPETVYSYSATCDHYGCAVYEPYYLNYRIIESCDLEGESGSMRFTIRNFSSTPVPPDCTELRQFSIRRSPHTPNPKYDDCINTSEPSFVSCTGLMVKCNSSIDSGNCSVFDNRTLEYTPASHMCFRKASMADRACDVWRYPDEYYNTTPVYDQCMAESAEAYDRCYQYLAECDPASEKDCGNWVIDGRYVKHTPTWQSCVDDVEKKRQACDIHLARLDTSSITMWIDPSNGMVSGEARRECVQRFVIPPDNKSSLAYVPPMQVAHIEMKNEAGSIWCRIVEFFGGRCP